MKTLLHCIPGLRGLIEMRREVLAMRWELAAVRRAAQDQLGATTAAVVHALLKEPRYADPRHLAHFELRVHSQTGEDGIIAEIFRRIGAPLRTFLEVGSESGVETNTTLLLRRGWRGFWVDGDRENMARARTLFPAEIASGQLTLIEATLTSGNAADVRRDAGVPADVDLISLDIDRSTSHLWRALGDFRARVMVVEYNASFGPRINWVIDDDATLAWNDTVNFGASLAACEQLGSERGYALVGCTLHGSNAFFVQASLADGQSVGPFTSEAKWEPPRYWLRWRDGHPTGPLR